MLIKMEIMVKKRGESTSSAKDKLSQLLYNLDIQESIEGIVEDYLEAMLEDTIVGAEVIGIGE